MSGKSAKANKKVVELEKQRVSAENQEEQAKNPQIELMDRLSKGKQAKVSTPGLHALD